MPARPVLVDVTRLITRLKHANPTGIDRVDLAYLRRYLGPGRGGSAVAATAAGVRLVPDSACAALLRALETRWQENEDASLDPGLARVQRWLAGPPRRPEAPGPDRTGGNPVRSVIGDALRTTTALRWPRVEAAPRGSLYLHTSHFRLDRPNLFTWLGSRPDIRPVFFVHDLIPIDFPEYVRPGEKSRHRDRMLTVANRAAGVIANSQDVADIFERHLATERLPRMPVAVAPLGVEPAFLGPTEPVGSSRPYIVILSTIEARKNHLLVLQIWRDLARALGDATPALVVLGRRGWESESAIDLLDRCDAIAPHVIEAPGLSTAAVARVVAGARALLMPSFTEGYGIPIVEALSLGTPVIASDIPAHREIAAGCATLKHPLDGPGWRDAILASVEPAPGGRVSGFRPPTWCDHFARVEALTCTL